MVKLKIIIRSGALVLRISENKDRFYKNVEYLLKGNPDLKHWKADREQFSGYSPFYQENNQALSDFKQIYWKLVKEHPELLDYNKMVQIAHTFAKGKAYVHHAKRFRAMLGKRARIRMSCSASHRLATSNSATITPVATRLKGVTRMCYPQKN